MTDKELIRRALMGSREAQKLKLKKVWRGMKERCEHPNHSSLGSMMRSIEGCLREIVLKTGQKLSPELQKQWLSSGEP